MPDTYYLEIKVLQEGAKRRRLNLAIGAFTKGTLKSFEAGHALASAGFNQQKELSLEKSIPLEWQWLRDWLQTQPKVHDTSLTKSPYAKRLHFESAVIYGFLLRAAELLTRFPEQSISFLYYGQNLITPAR